MEHERARAAHPGAGYEGSGRENKSRVAMSREKTPQVRVEPSMAATNTRGR